MNRFNTVARGATGERMKWIQRRLGVAESGTFDAATETALTALQHKNGLEEIPVFDPRTFAHLCWLHP